MPASTVPGQPPCLTLSWDGVRAHATGPSHCVMGGEAGPAGRRPVGIFAEWRWDGRRLEARTDRFGFQPLFYATDGSRLWLSPSIPELLRQGAPAELDDGALAVFLRLGVHLGDDTPFLHIRSAPPAARLVWEEGRLTVTGERAWRPLTDITRDRAIARYGELFRAAVARYEVDPERTVVPLTGGRDSRHILLELHAQGHAVPTVTVRPTPPWSDQDVTLAATVSEAVGVPHTVIETTRDRHADDLEKNLRTSMCTFEHYWTMALLRHLDGRGMVVYDGIAGDTLSEAKYMNAHRLELFRRWELGRYAAEELFPELYLPVILRPAMYRRLARGLALERLEAELRTHADAPNPVGSYRFWNRTRRAVALAPFALLATVATVRAPFLDDDLYDFLASLPGEMLVDRTFHTETIARSYPSFAGLPFELPQAPRRPADATFMSVGLAALRRELASPVRLLDGGRGGGLVRHGAYAARIAALLASSARRRNVFALVDAGTYLTQLEELAGRR
ncbi:MAG TPA: asparagine synthetase B family protein [Gemmatimonadales bacterium]